MKFLLSIVSLVLLAALPSQAQDRVERRDKKGASVVVPGKIVEETAGGLRMVVQGTKKEEMISAMDIVKITYGDVPLGVSSALAKLAAAEVARDHAAVLKGLEAILALPEVKNTGPAAQRYIAYRVASLRAVAADSDEQVKAAAKGLTDFVTANTDSWESTLAARQLGRLQIDAGDFAGATRTYEAIEKGANIPTEVTREATGTLLDIAFQSENFTAGKKRVAAVLADAQAPASLKDRATLYQLGLDGVQADEAGLPAAVKKIEAAIAATADPSLRALGYNLLGDCYLAKKQKRDAMWSYLWVDVQFNQDRGEHVKAMTRLVKLFEDEKDEDKVRLYKEKLARLR